MAFKLLVLLFSSALWAQSSINVGPQQVIPGLAKSGLPSYFANPACAKNEQGITDTNNILSRNTSSALGDLGTDCAIDASTSGHKAVFAWRTYPNRLESGNCEVVGYLKGDASLYKVNVVQNSVVLNGSSGTQLFNSTNGQEYSIQFPCGSDNSQAITVEIEATDNAAAAFNHVFLHGGEYQTFQAAQAVLAGRSSFAATSGCLLSRTNTALGALTDVAACPGPTIEKQVLGSWQTTDANNITQTINNLPAGDYELLVSVPWYGNTSTATLAYAVSDGTTTSGNTFAQPSGVNEGGGITLVAQFSYTSAGNRTFTVHCSASSGTCNIDNQTANRGVTFQLKRFPTASEQVLKIGAPGSEWTAYSPAITGLGTTTNPAITYQCLSGNLYVEGKFTTGTPTAAPATIPFPANFTTSVLPQGEQLAGTWIRGTASGTVMKDGPLIATSSGTSVIFRAADYTTARSPFGATNGNDIFGSGEVLSFKFTVPVTASSPCPRTPMPLVKQAVVYDTTVKAEGTAGVTSVEAGATTPTLVGVTNIAAVGDAACNYHRIADRVFVVCRTKTTCTSASGTSTTFRIPLPKASNLTSADDLLGTFSSNIIATADGEIGAVVGDATNDNALVAFRCFSTGSLLERFVNFSYVVK